MSEAVVEPKPEVADDVATASTPESDSEGSAPAQSRYPVLTAPARTGRDSGLLDSHRTNSPVAPRKATLR